MSFSPLGSPAESLSEQIEVNELERDMKSWMKVIGGAVLGLSLAAGIAVAENQGPRGGKMFDKLDTNGDGKITQEEMAAAREARFAKVDADGDGFVTQEEMTAHMMARHEERMKKMFERQDADGDGKLAAGEFGGHGAKMFEMMDADGDGAVTKEEAKAAREKMRAHHGKGPRGPGAGE